MTRLVSDLLDFARARAGQGIPLSVCFVDLGDVVRAAVEDVEVTHPNRDLRLTVDLRSRVCCDPDRMAQVVGNLVGNALKHGTPDTPVDVRVEDGGSDAVITVHNEGGPIPKELLPHVFEPFRRGADDGAPGVGLGLFIANSVVLAHHGSMEVRSEPGRGTTFIARLPKDCPPGNRKGEAPAPR
jgi:signal transduction histidine kinase